MRKKHQHMLQQILMRLTFRKVYFICFLLVCALLGIMAWLQDWTMMMPCQLSYIERMILMFLGVIFLAILLHNHTATSKKVWSWFAFVVSLLGILVTLGHVWLQIVRTSTPSALIFLFGNWVTHLYTPLCKQVQWHFLHINLEIWLLLFFVLFAVVCFWQQHRKHHVGFKK